jgi:hypothetical protein
MTSLYSRAGVSGKSGPVQTEEKMALVELIEQASDGDLIREMLLRPTVD